MDNSKRDELARAALGPLIITAQLKFGPTVDPNPTDIEAIARVAYQIADAMLARTNLIIREHPAD